MPSLILVRHAQAAYAHPDINRPLTPAGRQQARRLASHLADLLPNITMCAHSPAERTSETASILGDTLDIAHMWTEKALYSADVDTLYECARSFAGDACMIVGHEPTISQTGAYLAQDPSPVRWGVSTATALILSFPNEWHELQPSSCQLAVIDTPLL